MSHSEYDHRHYVVINVAEIPKLDFSEILETSEQTLRISNDGTKTFVKYGEHHPNCLEDCTSKSDPYSHHDFLEILSGPEWVGGLHGS